MKTKIQNKQAIFPMPVLLIATYNEDGTVNVMNAAWGTMVTMDTVALNLEEGRKTVQNMKKRGAFTVSIADAAHVTEADYFGIATGNKVGDKLSKTGLTAVKSQSVDAPVLNEFPICMECEYLEFQDGTHGLGVIGKVVNTLVEESVLTDGKVDISKLNAIAFDPYTNGYYQIGPRVGNAFRDGLKWKD